MPEHLAEPLSLYLDEASKTPLLTAEREKELARTMRGKNRKAAERARQEFRSANLLLVVHVAKKFRCSLSLDDRIQIGNLALMDAVEGFDPDLGFRFATYAVPCITHAILNALDRERPGQPLNGWADHEALALFADQGRQRQEAEAQERAKSRVTSFRSRVRELLGVLTEREAEVVSLRLGLDGEVWSQKEISDLFGVTRGGVHMLEKEAIRKLLGAVGAEQGAGNGTSHRAYAALFERIEAEA